MNQTVLRQMKKAKIMIKSVSMILLTLVWVGGTSALSQDKKSTEPPLLTFNDLKGGNSIEGSFKIAGFVIDIYECPPCPPGAICKPCIGDNIVVTDNLKERDPKLIRRLRIFTEKPNRFELNKSYTFTVTVRGNIRQGQAIENTNLISFEASKTIPALP
jgi:hypothetical protein